MACIFNPSSHTSCHRNWVMPLMTVVHTFNPRPRKDHKMAGNSSQRTVSFRNPWRQDCHFRTEVEVRASGWLFCLLDFQVEPQFLTLTFHLIVFHFDCYVYVYLIFNSFLYSSSFFQSTAIPLISITVSLPQTSFKLAHIHYY